MTHYLLPAIAVCISSLAIAQQDFYGTNINENHKFFLKDVKDIQNGEVKYLTRYTYNPTYTQLVKKEYYQIFPDNKGVVLNYTTFKYDDKNKLIETEDYTRTGENFTKTEIITYTYDEFDRVASWSQSIYRPTLERFRDNKKYEFTYDEKTQQIATITDYFATDDVPQTKISLRTFNYEKGLLKNITRNFYTENLNRNQVYNYDEKNLTTGGYWVVSKNGGAFSDERKYEVSHNTDGNVTEKQTYNFNITEENPNGAWFPNILYTYTYDDLDLSKDNTFYFKNEIDYIIEDLDDSKNLHTKKTALFDGKTRTFQYVYSGKILGTDEVSKNNFSNLIYPNPTKESFRLQSSEKVEQVEIFDLSGKLLKQFKNQEIYNINELKSGIYLLKIKSKNNTESLKLIKQ